jgi:hypothetical protein
MWTIAIVWIACGAIFLELADRAPTIEESNLGERARDKGPFEERNAEVVALPKAASGVRRAVQTGISRRNEACREPV